MIVHRIVALAAIVASASAITLVQDSGGAPREVVPFTDDRIPIALSNPERAFIRREMRGFLATLQEIAEDSTTGDRAQVAATARRSGMNGPEKDHIPPSLAPKLPKEFKQLGLATHRAFDAIADAAARPDEPGRTLKRVGDVMRNCVACHSTWRIVEDRGR
jgi:hypothetical protein